MLGVEAFPALVYSVMCLGLPESPRWLIGRKGDRAGGLAVLKRVHPDASEAQLEGKADEIASASHEAASTGGFWSKRLRTPILLASLGLCSWAFFTKTFSIVPVCIFAFIAAHAIGQGAVIWVLISEIFPNRHRAQGQSLGSFTHWIFAALLTLFFPAMVTAFAPGIVFAFFCFMMVLQLVWVKLMVPEKKGRSLEEIQHDLHIS